MATEAGLLKGHRVRPRAKSEPEADGLSGAWTDIENAQRQRRAAPGKGACRMPTERPQLNIVALCTTRCTLVNGNLDPRKCVRFDRGIVKSG
jgi:hypothetical protein